MAKGGVLSRRRREGKLFTKSTKNTGSGESWGTRHPGREQPRVSRPLSTSARVGGGVGREINDRVAR